MQRLPHNQRLARLELAHACGDNMYRYFLIALGPREQDVVSGLQLCCIVGEPLPPPALERRRICDPQPTIALLVRW